MVNILIWLTAIKDLQLTIQPGVFAKMQLVDISGLLSEMCLNISRMGVSSKWGCGGQEVPDDNPDEKFMS